MCANDAQLPVNSALFYINRRMTSCVSEIFYFVRQQAI